VQYYIEEQKGNIDYQGWAGKQDSDYDDDVNIVSVKFAWQVCVSVCACVLSFDQVRVAFLVLMMLNIYQIFDGLMLGLQLLYWQDDDPDVEIKPMSTFLCGSTVEFEIAILTMVFLAGQQEGDTHLKLGNEKIKVTCYPQKQRYGGPKIATAFLEVA
jgi:hypothetical protein